MEFGLKRKKMPCCPRCDYEMISHEDVYGLYFECEYCGYLVFEKSAPKGWRRKKV